MSEKFITKVSIWFNSEGAAPSEVIHKLLELGFTPVRGAYDFVYSHHEDVQDDITKAILETSDALHKTLSGFNVMYTLDTHRADDEDQYIPLDDIDAELEATRQELEELEDET
jgi:hypothetical protein